MMYVYTILSVVGWVWCALFFVGYIVAVKVQKRRAHGGIDATPRPINQAKNHARNHG